MGGQQDMAWFSPKEIVQMKAEYETLVEETRLDAEQRAQRLTRLLLWKRYFEIGSNITVYFKYLIALFGLSSRDVATTMLLGLLYAIVTFVVGWQWHKGGMMRAEFVIMNKYNDLADDVRSLRK